jgi:hypothetical protein
VKTSATNRRIHQLLSAVSEGKLNPRPDFQRRLVWTNDDKVSFIRTVRRGLPFPEIYVCAGSLNPDTGESTEYLVDGQQRVTTLHQYFKGLGGLRLGDSVKPYAGLSTTEKEEFLEYEVVVRDLGKHDIAQIREIFELINSANYALNSVEIKNARYAGAFKKFCEQVAGRAEFKAWKIFKLSDVKRMQDLRYCLVLVATLLSTYFNRDDGIEDYLSRFNDTFPDEMRLQSELDQCFAFVRGLGLPLASRAFRKTDLFSLLVEVHRALFKRAVTLDSAGVGLRLQDFYADVETASSSEGGGSKLARLYYWSTVRAAIDRGNRVRRGEILQNILDPTYALQLRFSANLDGDGALQADLELEEEEGDF